MLTQLGSQSAGPVADERSGQGTGPTAPWWARNWRDRVPALVVLAVIVVTFGVWMTRPGGDLQGAKTQSITVTGISGPIEAATTITQQVRATENNLKGFAATFGTYFGATDCALDVRVTDPSGAELSDQRVPCAGLIDTSNASQVASFPAITNSSGRVYTVTYRAAPGVWSEVVTLWVGKPLGASLPASATSQDAAVLTAFQGNDAATATLAEYAGPSAWDQIWLAMLRLSLGGPWWSQPAALAVWALVLVGSLVGAAASARSRWRAATILIVVVAVCRGLIWASLLPPLEGMDESAHVSYAQFLAEARSIPVRGENFDGLPNQYSDQLSILDEFQRRDALLPGDRATHSREAISAVDSELSAASPDANGASPGAGYPPAYYLPAAAIYQLTPGTLDEKIYGMRLWSVALGALAAWATMYVSRRLFPRSRITAVALAIAVTLQPMISHQFAIVNNDALAITAGIAAFAMALRLAEGRVRARNAAIAGAMVGCALLAKPYGIGVLPVVGIGLIIGSIRSEARLRTFLSSCAAGLGGLAGTYGIWVLTQRVMGIPSTTLPVYSDGDPSRGGWHYVQLQTQANFTSMRWRWGEQLFGTFSWLDIRLPGPAYGAVWWGLKLTLAVTVAWLILQVVLAVRHLARRGWKRDPSRLTSGLSNPTRTWLSLANLIGVFVALYAAGYLYFRFSGRDELLQGRYALLALPALLAMPALALEGLLARLRWPWARWLPGATMCAIALAMWVLQVIGVAAIADRFYL